MVFLTLYFLGWFGLLTTAIVLFARRQGSPLHPVPQPLPRVSILIAARNEEAAIARCLRAIRALHYPPDLVEVLLGNDGSTDDTAAQAQASMEGYAGSFQIISIEEKLGTAHGKANVLAHLARVATSEYFFITDADIAVPASWLQGLLGHLAPGVGIVTGLTLVTGARLFHRLQGLDWLMSLGLVQVVTDLGRPVTAMGNNMLITRVAYEDTGGYEQLPFSIIEDFELFKAVLRHGYTSRNVFRPEVLAESLPIYTWRGLLHQRRRWMLGVEALPAWLKLCLGLYGSFHLVLLALAWLAGLKVALGVWLLKMLLQGGLAVLCFGRVGRRAPLELLPMFELYTILLTAGLTTFRLLPLRFEWKGRRYS
ncbi:Glycosyltransferase, catalytic subunit of cellulose synthase and poly-beta-1,6-N-acetylglucosamine synthase [Hymenobacter gelipurpurascens]|uniref:Glycosyltransferase, catalytic subunit of cellulose synthase and poly-beta-1,6-N-acetylglucosamine synthase n=1 Tax=Hymenobacter gelipurpurascens TaxID=89968 RepID=A0A212TJ39_9BACT|nr:glycosyltransferase [Hymenobacter gelipurpurascens]SNC66068.1 Glycosyltransferase, catalytic subunit of cellulose synthase and poly-beta-1,6-N-acetylglucosamine synthase [Hymenobacter gelipurpurascens]